MNAQKDAAVLACNLEATATANGDIALSFSLENLSGHPVDFCYFKPFVDFTLTVRADDGKVEVVQPSYDTGVQEISLTLPAGETMRLVTPIRLQFDPDVAPSGGDEPTRWTLRHVPAPVLLRADLQLSGATVAPCEVYFDPGR